MRDHRSGTARALPAVLALLVLATACSGPRGGTSVHALTSDVTGCAAALPVARASVPKASALVEVRPLKAATALHVLQTAGGAPLPHQQVRGRLCFVAYRGPYRRGDVPLAPAGHGRYALLLLSVRHPHVLALVLVPALPRER